MLTDDDWANVVRHYGLKGEWAPSLGPPPENLAPMFLTPSSTGSGTT